MPASSRRWHFRDMGPDRAPVLVLLHSIATCGAMWTPQLAVWSEHFRLVIPDLPGHGESPPDPQLATFDDYADGVVRLLDELRVTEAALVGLSFGGMIAQNLTVRHPGRVAAVVIANSLAHMPEAGKALWEERKRAAGSGMRSQVEDSLRRWFTPEFHASSPLTLAWVRAMIERVDPTGYGAAVGALQKLDHVGRLGEIRCPALVLTGDKDPVASPSSAASMASQIPGAQLEILERAAHLSNIELPTVFTERVGRFLRRSLANASGQEESSA